ncbi:MAG: hypothetical protein CMM76_05470 [Rhodospirillaceae bacterium]|nr:hypothetical protein [Rhodospirillaceae bacterium]
MASPKMIIDALSERIDGHAIRVIIGLNWTVVEGPTGIGLAHTPVRGTSGCYGVSNAGELSGKPLSTFVVGLTSANPFDRALALAAINAHHNNFSLNESSANGIDLAAKQQNETVVIGRFPGLRDRLPEAKVIERDPGPHDFPIAAAPELLADAKTLLITASTLSDGSLSKYLALAPDAFTVLIGPGTPLSPSLFKIGINILAGFVVDEKEKAFIAIAQGAAVKALKSCGRNVCLQSP